MTPSCIVAFDAYDIISRFCTKALFIPRRHGLSGCLRIINRLHDRTLGTLVQAVQLLHILAIQLKAVNVGVTLDSARGVALRQRHPVLLQAIPDEHLSGALTVLLGDGVEGLVLGLLVADEWTICFYDDALLLTVGYSLALLVPGVQLFGSAIVQKLAL